MMRYILKSPRRLAMVVLDLVMFAACYYLAFYLRLESWKLPGHLKVFRATLLPVVVIEFAAIYLAGAYRGIWRYVGMNDLTNILKGAVYGTVGAITWVVFVHGTYGYPRSVFGINAVLVVLVIGGMRFAWRFIRENVVVSREGEGKPVIIVGAGDAADDLIREIRHNPRLPLRPLGIVDDSPDKLMQELHGVKVIGGVGDLPRLAREKGAAEILIAIPSATGAEMRRIVGLCRESGVPYRTVPGAGDILDGRVKVSQLRSVRPEDLLRRAPVHLDRSSLGAWLGGKRVMVTGAGGSIGSEICRQVARFDPAEIVMLDHSENSLFYLDEEFQRSFPGVRRRLTVADITNSPRMQAVFRETRPAAVFHAAAHKHVPLMEANPWEAFRNNVGGSITTARAACEAGVGTFVMISTDKAVNPTSVMGLSKRVAELAVQSMNREGCEFVSVRFGNVMGSEGSVIPLFTRQIVSGGPVTVTHPEVVRYFMTIPEASQLVLQAAALGQGGEIFVLDMGEPIRIVDLAREMIRLSGLEPDVDIEIRITGLRPGEKLFEELVTAGEGVAPTSHEKIMVFRPEVARGEVAGLLDEMESLLAGPPNVGAVIALARRLVPEYRPAEA
jgi:FlaA1/EpsC-like NDP-sugar epimerase